MSDSDDKLSPNASPKIMEIKTKRARRINNWPVFIVFVVFGVIALTLGLVVVSRSSKAKADIGRTTIKPSDAFAKELTANAAAGVVEPPAPVAPAPREDTPPPQVTDVPPKAELPQEPPSSDGKAQVTPRMTEEARKVQEKHWRQVEAAIDGPIKAQMDDVKTTPRSVSAELAEVERQLTALGNMESQGYVERLAAIRAAIEGDSGASDYSRRGDLSRMNQFAANADNWQNPATVESPSTMHIIRTGSVIPATLIGGINSDLPGQIVGQVAQDVYDTPTGKHILIPQGSRLVGEYSSDVQYGQSRVFAVWQRVIFPDGKALDLGAMPGSTGAGYSGFRDRVNNHYVRIFGSAIMMSAILAGVEMTQNNQDYNQGSNQQRMSDAMSEALGNQLGGVMAEMLQKNMNIAPTLEIRPGYRFNVMLVKDLVFNGPYSGFDYARR